MGIAAIPVFFDPRMVVRCPLPSPSARKPEAVVGAWAGLPIELCAVEPATRADFGLAHDAAHVDGILSGALANGFDTHDVEVIDSLAWTTGSMLSACRRALVQGVACSPTSGFHHAGWAQSWGFCTFNGLMVAARRLLLEGKVQRIGILDCDQHHGDGTESIVDHLKLRGAVEHITARSSYPHDADAFMAMLPALLQRFAGCDLLLYQAGADCHVDDPLGGFLDSAQMRARDRMTFEHCARVGLPVAWNLAGGYQEPVQKVIDLHVATMQECVGAFVR